MKCTCFVNGQECPCPFCIYHTQKWAWLTHEVAQKILKERDWAFQLKQQYTGWDEGMVGPHTESGFVTTIMGQGSGVVGAVKDALRKEEREQRKEAI